MMERDKQVALGLLTSVRDLEGIHGVDARNLARLIYSKEQRLVEADVYHLRLLVEGGYLVEGKQEMTGASIFRLTWAGHELMDQLQKDVFHF
jgi:hypothetical protein